MATNVDGTSGSRFTLIDLLRHPLRGWRRIAASRSGFGATLAGVAAPLAAVRAGAGLVHDQAYGRGAMGIIQYRPTIAGAVLTAVLAWAFWIAALVALALAIAAIAPRFGGERDRAAALRLAAWGSAPFFLAGLFLLAPPVGFLQLLGLYSLLLIANGGNSVMGVPDDRAGLLGPAAAGIAFVLAVAVLFAIDAVAGQSVHPTVKTTQGRVVVAGAATLDGARVSAPASSKKGPAIPGSGGETAVPASSLQTLLPERIGDFTRTTVESQSAVSAGVATADAKGTYVEGTNSFTLTISDAGGSGALATSNSVIAGETDRVTDSGYQRSRLVNGVRIIEKWSYAGHGGSYSRAVAGRFTVEAQGTAPNIETLRGAVAAIDTGRLGALDRR